MNLDEMRLASEAGISAVDALYEKYNIARNEHTSLMIDPNVEDATYSLTLADGKRVRIEARRNPDGSMDIKVIGQD